MKKFSLFILSLLFCTGYMSGADWNVYVARYKQDKACAISYTFVMDWRSTIHWLLPNWKREVFGEHSGYAAPI